MAGESKGRDYGVRGTSGGTDNRPWVQIGFLHAEFPFDLGGKLFPLGSYVVTALPDAVELSGDDPNKTHYDSYRRTAIPDRIEQEVKLKTRIPAILLAEKAPEIPRFSLSVEAGAIVFNILDNRVPLKPRE